MDGTVLEQVGVKYKVQLDDGSVVMAGLSGKMRMNYVRVFAGDRVKVEYNVSEPIITYRYKQ